MYVVTHFTPSSPLHVSPHYDDVDAHIYTHRANLLQQIYKFRFLSRLKPRILPLSPTPHHTHNNNDNGRGCGGARQAVSRLPTHHTGAPKAHRRLSALYRVDGRTTIPLLCGHLQFPVQRVSRRVRLLCDVVCVGRQSAHSGEADENLRNKKLALKFSLLILSINTCDSN